jgi:hypothetical protein
MRGLEPSKVPRTAFRRLAASSRRAGMGITLRVVLALLACVAMVAVVIRTMFR